MKINKQLILFVSLIPFMSCDFKNQPQTKEEFAQWFTEVKHGCVKSKEVGELIYTVYYKPTDIMLLNELESNKVYSKKHIDSLKNTYAESEYFVLEIQSKNNETNLEYQQLNKSLEEENVNYSAFSENVKLISGSDTLAPTMYHVEKGYELGMRQRFMFAFPASIKEGPMTFELFDVLFNSSILKFKFDNINKEDFPELPIAYND